MNKLDALDVFDAQLYKASILLPLQMTMWLTDAHIVYKPYGRKKEAEIDASAKHMKAMAVFNECKVTKV